MIAVEDEVFAEAQFGTYDDAKATALKIKRQRKRTNSRSHSSEGNDDPVSPMSDEFPKVSSLFSHLLCNVRTSCDIRNRLRPDVASRGEL